MVQHKWGISDLSDFGIIEITRMRQTRPCKEVHGDRYSFEKYGPKLLILGNLKNRHTQNGPAQMGHFGSE